MMSGFSSLHGARLVFFLAALAAATTSLVSACTDETTVDPDPGDASTDGRSGDAGGSTGTDEDASGTADATKDAGKDARPKKDANGPGEAGIECSFNHDCQLALRCECDEKTGCSCQPGARGTGQNGIDTCDSGNQCASSLCVEGPNPDESICSDECTDPSDCTGKLPKCIPVAFVGTICVREPPK